MNAITCNMLRNHDPEPCITAHCQKVAVLAFLKTMSLVSAVVLSKNLFNWRPDEAAKKVRDIKDNYRLVDGNALVGRLMDGSFYLETGDRIKALTEGFLSQCAPDWAQQLREATGSFPV
jgi:hypothetical protein